MAAHRTVKTMPIMNAGRMAAVLLLMAAAMACAPGNNKDPVVQEDRQSVIVEFTVPGTSGGAPADRTKAIRQVADAILARLDAPVRESARSYDHLPLVALETDAASVMQLLRMPEVVSIQPDHPVSLMDRPGGIETYGAPSRETAR